MADMQLQIVYFWGKNSRQEENTKIYGWGIVSV